MKYAEILEFHLWQVDNLIWVIYFPGRTYPTLRNRSTASLRGWRRSKLCWSQWVIFLILYIETRLKSLSAPIGCAINDQSYFKKYCRPHLTRKIQYDFALNPWQDGRKNLQKIVLFPFQSDWVTYSIGLSIIVGLMLVFKYVLPAQLCAPAPLLPCTTHGVPCTTQGVPIQEEETPGLQSVRVDPKGSQVRFYRPRAASLQVQGPCSPLEYGLQHPRPSSTTTNNEQNSGNFC